VGNVRLWGGLLGVDQRIVMEGSSWARSRQTAPRWRWCGLRPCWTFSSENESGQKCKRSGVRPEPA
jgi:hypothetical protein